MRKGEKEKKRKRGRETRKKKKKKGTDDDDRVFFLCQEVEADVSFRRNRSKKKRLAFFFQRSDNKFPSIRQLTGAGGGFSSGKSERKGASLSPTSLTSLTAGATARAATEEEEEERSTLRRPIFGAAAAARARAASDDDALREAVDVDACAPRMLMARILYESNKDFFDVLRSRWMKE